VSGRGNAKHRPVQKNQRRQLERTDGSPPTARDSISRPGSSLTAGVCPSRASRAHCATPRQPVPAQCASELPVSCQRLRIRRPRASRGSARMGPVPPDESGAVGPRQPRHLDLALEHGDLMARDEDLGVLGPVGPGEERQPNLRVSCQAQKTSSATMTESSAPTGSSSHDGIAGTGTPVITKRGNSDNHGPCARPHIDRSRITRPRAL
jgi:hypothetical protein